MLRRVLRAEGWKLGLSLFWFIFTFSLVIWWWIFSLEQLELLTGVLNQHKFESLQRMLIWEGAVLVSAVFCGGFMLVMFTYKEKSRNQRLRNFFSNFAHDLKTSLTRLRLRTEVLAEKAESPEYRKLLEEVSRLDLQLENSLWVARGDSQKLYAQKISLSQTIGFLRVEWPELEIKLHQDAEVVADGHALKSIFRNLFQNAWLHGKATRIDIKPHPEKNQWRIAITDNGQGYAGDNLRLGSPLLKSRSEQGNGVGLYLTRDLLERMHGRITFPQVETGFCAEVSLPRAETTTRAQQENIHA